MHFLKEMTVKKNLNRVTIVGNLTRDAELKYLNNGTAVCELSVAVNDGWKSGDKWTEYVSYIDCTIMGKRAESLNKYLAKGTRVGVDGKLKQERWESDGGKRSRVKIMIDEIELLGGKPGTSGESASGPEDFNDDAPF